MTSSAEDRALQPHEVVPQRRVAVLLPDRHRPSVVSALTRAGCDCELPADPVMWAQSSSVSGIGALVVVLGDGGADLTRTVHRLAPAVPIVVLVEDEIASHYREAFSAGAWAVAGLSSPPDELAQTILLAFGRQVRLPTDVVLELACGRGDSGCPHLEIRERRWLMQLARGVSIEAIARREGVSTRQQQRRLQHVYAALGADSKVSALLRADRLGLMDDRDLT